MDAEERRRLGKFYTPAWLAKELLDGYFASPDVPPRPRILDPSCGAGVFLHAAFDRLLAPGADRLALVRDCLFGIDVDEEAVRGLRASLLSRIDPRLEDAPRAAAILESNIRCADFLADARSTTRSTQGAALSTLGAGEYGAGENEVVAARGPADNAPLPQHPGCSKPHPGCFPLGCFPSGCFWPAAFDLVVGNPPYLRELRARELFDRVACSPLGRWRQARMDYWHYFVHRGLDVLRPGGRLAFVVSGYWTASTGASKLIGRLRDETTLEAIRLLDDEPVFDGVAGRHLTFRLRRGREGDACRVTDRAGTFEVPQGDLYRHGRLSVARPDVAHSQMGEGTPLGRRFLIRQGIAENPPVITKRHAREFPERYRTGEGVFVLTADEVEAIDPSPEERALLRPYYRAADIERFFVPTETGRFLLYLTRATAPDLDAFARIRTHLERFRPLLERRREVERGRIAWWHLHWPREERLFLEPRIVAVQMGKTPRFAVARHPTFVGFAVNVIVARAAEESPGQALSLDVLCGILNSSLAARWFDRHAKHRGAKLDISGHVLAQFPLPGASAEHSHAMEELVRERRDHRGNGAPAIDDRMGALVEEWYG